MRPPLKGRARGRQLRRLREMFRRTRCPRTRLRVLMVFLAHEGRSIAEIARTTPQGPETVRRWRHRFREAGGAGLYDAPHTGRPPEVTSDRERLLRAWVFRSPRDFGIPRPTWTTAGLAQVLRRRCKARVTDECVRRHRRRRGIVCRRPTGAVKHLARQPPGYAQKRGRLPGCCGSRRAARTSTCRTRRS
jgi:transposase